ncbi:RNA polymerase subunit sigma-24 [Enterobacter cloacae]|uniref:RNA polymerase subunit sigma-24 n=1 Tax=Enterobacter cloacae TaxID=550 RepID=A0A2T4Y2J2_ENTCL|nr:RNA polymerase sigma factor [Enterobacter cloacae]PTM36407.1 RNA polymerase subunit sigma-24 [Enterobacter cloacae]
MKAGEAGGSMLMSALNACRARLKAFIRGRTSVRDDADDILQEVTYQLMKVEQPVENVAAWLFRAARNEMIDRSRKKREVSLSGYFTGDDEDGFPEDELAETLFGVSQTPEEEYLKTLLWEELEQALSELPPPQREVFEKTELHGYSIKMLAEETGASEQALLSRKHKAVLFLRTRLRDVYDALTGE